MPLRIIMLVTFAGLATWFIGATLPGATHTAWNAIWKGLAQGWAIVLVVVFIHGLTKRK